MYRRYMMADVTLDGLSAIKERLIEASYDEGLWDDALGSLRSAMSGSSVALAYWGGRPIDQLLIHSDCSPEYAQSFFAPELRNPFLPASRRLTEGGVITDTTLMAREEFRLTPIYNEWLRPQGEHSYLQCKVLDEGDVVAHFGMLRGGRQDTFGAADLQLLGEITPVLSRAVKLRRRLGMLRLSQDSKTYGRLGIGLAIVDSKNRLLHHNASMEAILKRPSSGLSLIRGTLGVIADVPRHRFHSLVAETSRPVVGGGADLLILSPQTGAPSLAMSITPIPDPGFFGLPLARAVMILVKDLSEPVDFGMEGRLATLFGFTTREASLAIALASGYSLQDVAEERSISLSTVRTQLAKVFRKTSTSQQSQLVALLVKAIPVLSRD